jgi:hypothetical protein
MSGNLAGSRVFPFRTGRVSPGRASALCCSTSLSTGSVVAIMHSHPHNVPSLPAASWAGAAYQVMLRKWACGPAMEGTGQCLRDRTELADQSDARPTAEQAIGIGEHLARRQAVHSGYCRSKFRCATGRSARGRRAVPRCRSLRCASPARSRCSSGSHPVRDARRAAPLVETTSSGYRSRTGARFRC